MSLTHGGHVIHHAKHLLEQAVENDHPVGGNALAAGAGVTGAVGVALVIGSAPISIPVIAIGTGLGLLFRAIGRAGKS